MNNTMNITWAEEAWKKITEKMPATIQAARQVPFIPYTVKDGAMAEGPMDGICWWTNGFWPAMMWQLYAGTREGQYLQEARRSQQMLAEAFKDFKHLHHDVGFMWRIATGFDHELTGEAAARDTTLFAAHLLAGRYNPNGFFLAWNDDKTGWAIIDCMMNLSILYWASEQTGDPRFRLMATNHADTVQKHFIRPDGTSEHIVAFNPEDGTVVDKLGGQGYGPGSVWTRGQGWAIYGFAISYAHTHKQAYLDTACQVADAFLTMLGEDDLVLCDFRAPKEPVIYDDCAAGIVACGLLEIAEHLDAASDQAKRYVAAAEKLLHGLVDHHVNWSPDYPALLTHCTGAYHSNDHEIAMVYGDYYLVEGLRRLLGGKGLRW